MRLIRTARTGARISALGLLMFIAACGGGKKSSGDDAKNKEGEKTAVVTPEIVASAVKGVEFDPEVAAKDTGKVRGIAVASVGLSGELGGSGAVSGQARGASLEPLPGAPPRGTAGIESKSPLAPLSQRGERGDFSKAKNGIFPTPRRQAGENAPIAGARVRIEGTSLTTVSDEKGAFSFPFVPPGDYMFIGEKQGASGEVFAFAHSATITASTGPEDPGTNLGELSLAETGAISGKVTRADATSQLGIDVFIPGTNFVSKTDDNGNFKIIYIPKGKYGLAAMFPGFDPFRWKDIVVEPKRTTPLEAVELKHSSLDKAKAASIFGRVTAAGGGGVVGATVTTMPETRTVQSDDSGNFILSNIPPGVYAVRAARAGFAENSKFVDLGEKLFGEIEIRLAPDAQILSVLATAFLDTPRK